MSAHPTRLERGTYRFVARLLLSGQVLAAATSALAILAFAAPAEAIPAFARQTGFSCGHCHTIPPRLTRVGTMFKMGGYTLIGAGYSEMDLDKGRIPRSLLLSARLLGTPYSKQEGQPENVNPIDQARVYLGGRITDEIGLFAQTNFHTDGRASTSWIRAAYATNVSPNVQLGIQGGRSSAAAGDPFDSIQRMMAWTEERNIISSGSGSTGSGLVNMHDAGRGFTGHAFLYNQFYVGAGVYDVQRRASGPTPKSAFLRGVYLPSLGSTYTHIGAFHYDSNRFDRTVGSLTGTSEGTRTGFDFSSQIPLNERLLLDLIGFVVRAKDIARVADTTPFDVEHGGVQFAASLVHDRRVAVALGYGRYEYDDTNPFGGAAVAGRTNDNLNLNFTYMLRSNARLSLDVTRRTRAGAKTNGVGFSYDFGF